MSETVTMTLTDFMLARIAEDETAAGTSLEDRGSGTWHAHILAECESKRQILDLHMGVHECAGIKYGHQACVYVHPDFAFRHDPTLCLLALTYADHPDYDESWRP